MFPSGKKDAGDAVEYDGGRSSGDIVSWALDKLAENVPPPEPTEVSLGCFYEFAVVQFYISQVAKFTSVFGIVVFSQGGFVSTCHFNDLIVSYIKAVICSS